MRIAFITTEYVTEDYYSGGLANYVHRVAKALVSLGHEVHVVTLSQNEEESFMHDGISVYRVNSTRTEKLLNRLTRCRVRGTAHWLGYSVRAYTKLKEVHKKKPFDMLQIPNSRGCGLVASLLLPIPYAVRISCYRPVWNELGRMKRNLDTRATEWLEFLQLLLSRHIYAPSDLLRGMLANRALIRNVRVIRTPFYMETAEFDTFHFDRHLKGKDYLLFFGRFQLHKGFHILAKAMPTVFKSNPNLHGAFVGLDCKTAIAASMKTYALSMCREFADRLVFIDQIPHRQLYPIIAGARLVVLPSLVDNLPNACLEAMALGRPVVATAGASFEELIIDGETGFLMPAGNVRATAAKINEAWMHPDLNDIGLAAKRKVQELALERTIRELLVYYESIINVDNQEPG
jgi:glycosyltransferase involved in cell wall biosynthesis